MYEIAVRGCAGVDEALALQEPIARLLCPEPDHDGPCPVPWEFTLGDAEDPDADDGKASAVLLLGVHASRAGAAEVAARVRELAGDARQVSLAEGAPGRYEALLEQHRVERG
ncbi:hypothetical protein [Streptomyces sp. B6B3]|uniref:hypothetical protein n=1 Tax=Streptomyces sp. B6B3 TaxID=3153570 RepID=UPI00325E7003